MQEASHLKAYFKYFVVFLKFSNKNKTKKFSNKKRLKTEKLPFSAGFVKRPQILC